MMWRKYCRWVCTLVCALITVSAARQGLSSSADVCAVETVAPLSAEGIVYYPLSAEDQRKTLTVRLKHSGRCKFALGFLPATAPVLQGPGDPMRIDFLGQRGQLIAMNGNPYEFLGVQRAINTTELSFQVRFPSGQVRPAGEYGNTFALRIFSGGEVLQELDLRLSVEVAAQADIQLAGNGGRSYSGLDFGKLHSGAVRSALMSVRSTGAYSLEVVSENRSVLKHETAEGDIARIPYSAWLDGVLLDLGSGVGQSTYDPAIEKRHFSRLKVQVGETRERLAGEYRDTLRVTVLLLE